MDCYHDEKHRICSFQNDIEEKKKTCEIDISKVNLPKNYQITGSKLFTESKIGSVHSSRPLLVALEREKTESVRHIVKSYVERQLESLTHYSRIEVDNNSIIPSIPSARDKVILRSLLRQPDSNLRNPIIFVVLPSQKIIPFSADLNFNAQDNKMTESLTQ